MSSSCKFYLLCALTVNPTSGTTPQIAPRIFHTEHFNAGSLVIISPEHTFSIHCALTDCTGVTASSVAKCCLTFGCLSHHHKQILKQQSICQNFRIPIRTVCLSSSDFSSCILTNHISLSTDGTHLIGNQRTKVNRCVEMIDLIILSIIIAPTIPSIILRSIRATEVINTILFPTLCENLRPFHHCVTAKCSVSNLGR